jgi:hypothetical protein
VLGLDLLASQAVRADSPQKPPAARDPLQVGLLVFVFRWQRDEIGEPEAHLIGILVRIPLVVADEALHRCGLIPGEPEHPPAAAYHG